MMHGQHEAQVGEQFSTPCGDCSCRSRAQSEPCLSDFLLLMDFCQLSLWRVRRSNFRVILWLIVVAFESNVTKKISELVQSTNGLGGVMLSIYPIEALMMTSCHGHFHCARRWSLVHAVFYCMSYCVAVCSVVCRVALRTDIFPSN